MPITGLTVSRRVGVLMAPAPSEILPAFALADAPLFSPKLPITRFHGSKAGQAAGGGWGGGLQRGTGAGRRRQVLHPWHLQALLAWRGFSVFSREYDARRCQAELPASKMVKKISFSSACLVFQHVKARLRWHEGRSQSQRDSQRRRPRRVGTHRGLCRDGWTGRAGPAPLGQRAREGSPEGKETESVGPASSARACCIPAHRQESSPEGAAPLSTSPPASRSRSFLRGSPARAPAASSGRRLSGAGRAGGARARRGAAPPPGAGWGRQRRRGLRLPPAASRRGARSGAAAGSAHHPAAAREPGTRTEVTAGAFRGVIGSVRGCPPARARRYRRAPSLPGRGAAAKLLGPLGRRLPRASSGAAPGR